MLPSRRAATSRATVRLVSDDNGAAFEAFEKARAMKVSEIKAELDLRGISYEGLYEKSELARALAESRASGRADPEILDNFNRQKMEKMMDENAGVVDIDLEGDDEGAGSLEDAVAALERDVPDAAFERCGGRRHAVQGCKGAAVSTEAAERP